MPKNAFVRKNDEFSPVVFMVVGQWQFFIRYSNAAYGSAL